MTDAYSRVHISGGKGRFETVRSGLVEALR
jgi:hypothetical protein